MDPMKNLLYFLSSAFFIFWFLGFIIFNLNSWIHLFFLIGVIAIVLQLLKETKKQD